MARTIDNLGIETSTRYAQDRIFLDEKILEEARTIPMQTQITVTGPAYTSEFDLLFELGKRNATWADFFAPPKYYEQKKRLFSDQMIPILGSIDKQEAQAERITAMKKSKEREEKEKKRPSWQQEREEEEEEREKKILLTLLEQIKELDLYLIDINSRRTQYQKG